MFSGLVLIGSDVLHFQVMSKMCKKTQKKLCLISRAGGSAPEMPFSLTHSIWSGWAGNAAGLGGKVTSIQTYEISDYMKGGEVTPRMMRVYTKVYWIYRLMLSA